MGVVYWTAGVGVAYWTAGVAYWTAGVGEADRTRLACGVH